MTINDLKILYKKLALQPPHRSKEPITNTILKQFPLKTPADFVDLIQKGNINDPLLLQILPTPLENKLHAKYKKDPLNEIKYQPIPGIIHKYHGRVLLLTTSNCVINCRFCFRRHQRDAIQNWKNVYSYIEKDQTIEEVILSGGDPLTLSDTQLKNIIDQISKIKHVKYLRIHTRMPILCPERISGKLLQLLTNKKSLQPVIIVHCNHPNEITQKALLKLRNINKAGITTLNQSVLLKGINDSATTLIKLNQTLFKAKVLPYYLHILDKVSGAQHFCVDKNRAKKIFRELQENLPGYLVPKLVYDAPGAKAKQLIL